MSKFGKSIVVIGWVLVLASCATPDRQPRRNAAAAGGRGHDRSRRTVVAVAARGGGY